MIHIPDLGSKNVKHGSSNGVCKRPMWRYVFERVEVDDVDGHEIGVSIDGGTLKSSI